MSPRFLRKLCLSLLLVCNSTLLCAQDSLALDAERALLYKLKFTNSDETRLEAYSDLVSLVKYTDANKTLDYAKRGHQVAERLDDNSSQAEFLTHIGTGYLRAGIMTDAIRAFQKALRIKGRDRDSVFAYALNGLGSAYETIGDTSDAIYLFKKVQVIGDSLSMPLISSLGIGNIAELYSNRDYFLRAKPYLLRALNLSKIHNLPTIKAYALTDLAVVYASENMYDSAQQLIKSAIKLDVNPYITSRAYLKLSEIHFSSGEHSKSLKAVSTAIELAEDTKNMVLLAQAYNIKMKTLQTLAQYEESLNLGFQIQELAKQTQIHLEALEALERIADIYYTQGKYKQAYKYQKLYNVRNEENISKQRLKDQQISDLRLRLAKQKRANQVLSEKIGEGNTLVQNKKLFAIGMLLFAMILLIILLGLYGKNYEKSHLRTQSFAKIEQDQVTMYKKQMFNMIFVFYPLIIIHNYIWASLAVTLMHVSLLCVIVLAWVFLIRNQHFPLFWLSISFYLVIALMPLHIGPVESTFAAIIAVFLNTYYFSQNHFQRIINYTLFPACYGVYSYLSLVQPDPLTKDPFGYSLLVGFISICAIFLVMIYINKGTLDFKQALWKSNEFLRQITDLNPHFIFAKDSDGRFTLANKAMARTLGKSHEELIGRYGTQLVSSRIINEASLDDDIAVLKEGKTIDRKEEIMVNSRGESRYFHTIKKPIYNEHWEITGMLGVATDITELKIAERQRIEREATLNAIISSIPDPIFVIDSDLNPIILNKEFYHMTDIASISYKESIIGYLKRTLPKDFSQKYQTVIRKVLSGESYSGFDIIQTKEESRHYEISGTPVRDKGNNIIGAILLGINVTEQHKQRELINTQIQDLNQKNAELEKYIESNLSLENFAYLASHDLKAPLRTIISFSQLFEKRVTKKINKEEKELLNFVIGASKNMERLINDLLEYSRVNTRNISPTSFKLKPLIKEILNELSISIQDKKARFQLRSLPETIVADPTKFRRMLQNLITNALKFSKADKASRIMISVMDEEDRWVFMVKDNGIGIDEKYLNKIFLLFQRLHGDTDYEGSGIGLAMVRKIVEQHKGEIWVESVVGKGSKFFFSIPKDLQKAEQKAIT